MNLKFFDVGSASLIAIIEGDTTAHEVRQRARCHNCGVKGNTRIRSFMQVTLI